MTEALNIVFCYNQENEIKKTIDFLIEKKHAIFIAKNSEELSKFISEHTIHLVIIELDFKDKDAITITNDIRNQKLDFQPYIIIYSNKNDDYIQITAFNSGADDFIVTPLKPLLFEAKIGIIKKRLKQNTPSDTQELNASEFHIDKERYVIITPKGKATLPRKEFEMIYLLFQSPNKIFTRQDFANLIWNSPEVANSRTIDIHIRNIRRILGNDIIKTAKGIGYIFNKDLLK
jgi:two-component system alkaline phosphatase synthesis response regulator PhoP